MKRLVLALIILTAAPLALAQGPAPAQPDSSLANDPVFRQMVTERELLFKKLQDITEFQQFMQVERSIEHYVVSHPSTPTQVSPKQEKSSGIKPSTAPKK